MYRWQASGTTCVGYDKYTNAYKQYSTDSGQTWNDVIPYEYSATTLIEAYSEDCGYSPSIITYTAPSKLSIDLTTAFTPSATAHTFSDGVGTIRFAAPVTEFKFGAFTEKYAMTSIVIPKLVTSIGDSVFYDCRSLSSITIPDSVTSVGTELFLSCDNLASVKFGSGITRINDAMFRECVSLTSVTIPSWITYIDFQAFYLCSGLTSVIVEATTPPTLGISAFFTANDCPIYVPASSVDAYKVAEQWIYYADRIQPIPNS